MLTTGRMPLAAPDSELRRRTPRYSPEMTRALVDLVSTLVAGGPDIPHVDPATGDAGAGGAIYRLQCAACHQSAGQGGILVGQETPSLGASTAVQIAEATRTGPGTMPVFAASAITDEELDGLVAYVRDLQSPRDPGGHALWHLGPLPEGAVALCALGLIIVALRHIGSRS
jgi:ubiquinol-cytochrome c reductase cytochrome c subunit